MKRKSTILLSLLLTLTAVFSMPILSSCDDGVEISFATATAEEIEPITRKVGDLYGKLPVPTREGYTFLGWKTEKMGGEYARRSVKVEKDIDHTLYAKWRKDEVKITFPLEVKKERLDGAGGATFYIDEGGQLYAWGENNQGQLGDGTTEARLSPMAVLTDKKWAQVAGDSFGTMYGIDEDGGLWSWGTRKKNPSSSSDTTPPQLTPERIMPNKKFCAIEAGWGFSRSFALALDVNGGLWAWGDNYYGQLGQGGESSGVTESWTDSGNDTPVRIKKDVRFVEISTNGETCGAIDEEGKLWLWGDNENGELANGKVYDGNDLSTSMAWLSSSTPTVAVETEGVRFAQIYCAQTQTYAIDSEGNIWGCGDNSNLSRVGDGTNITSGFLKQVTKNLIFVQVYSSLAYSIALDEYGGFWWWGNGSLEVVWTLSCVHFEENPIHYEHLCEGLIMNVPTESAKETIKANTFINLSSRVYISSLEGELWGWQGEFVETMKQFINKENAGYTVGDGTWDFHGKDNPVKILIGGE